MSHLAAQVDTVPTSFSTQAGETLGELLHPKVSIHASGRRALSIQDLRAGASRLAFCQKTSRSTHLSRPSNDRSQTWDSTYSYARSLPSVHLHTEVLGLAPCHTLKNCRYVKKASLLHITETCCRLRWAANNMLDAAPPAFSNMHASLPLASGMYTHTQRRTHTHTHTRTFSLVDKRLRWSHIDSNTVVIFSEDLRERLSFQRPTSGRLWHLGTLSMT